MEKSLADKLRYKQGRAIILNAPEGLDMGISTDVNRDSIWEMIQDTTEYRLVSNIAIDDTWSALRLRLKSKVKSK